MKKGGVEVPAVIINIKGEEFKVVKSEGMLYILQPWIPVKQLKEMMGQ